MKSFEEEKQELITFIDDICFLSKNQISKLIRNKNKRPKKSKKAKIRHRRKK